MGREFHRHTIGRLAGAKGLAFRVPDGLCNNPHVQASLAKPKRELLLVILSNTRYDVFSFDCVHLRVLGRALAPSHPSARCGGFDVQQPHSKGVVSPLNDTLLRSDANNVKSNASVRHFHSLNVKAADYNSPALSDAQETMTNPHTCCRW